MTLPEARGIRTEKPQKEDRVIATFDKNSTEKIEVKIVDWKCQDYLDIRIWYTSNGKDFLPSKKGITLNIEFLPRLLNALQDAGKILKEDDKVRK